VTEGSVRGGRGVWYNAGNRIDGGGMRIAGGALDGVD
jgi:hypothetical protein